MFEKFKKWISCSTCVRATMTGLKTSLVAIGPTIIEFGPRVGIASEEISKWVGLVITAIGVVLVLLEKTSASVVLEAKDIQGVQVHVDTKSKETPESVVQLATGPTSDVFPMIGGPRKPSEHDDIQTADLPPPPQSDSSDGGGYKTLK